MGRGGSFFACLSHLTIGYTSRSRQVTAVGLNRDTLRGVRVEVQGGLGGG